MSRQPVLAAWGAGVDSTAMLIQMVTAGEPVDQVLFADTKSEKPATYAFIPVFVQWLAKRGVPTEIVSYQVKNFKNWPPYAGLAENCISNGTLPSKAFGFGSCSLKWKVAPQDKWTENWPLAQKAWASGEKVIKLIGYDCSPQDQRRYADREGYDDARYDYQYPLRKLGWKREDCIRCIEDAGLPVPVKSSCWMCPAMKPKEVDDLEKPLLRRIVLMEARAKPRLRNVEGLWRKSVKGERGATPKPGSITQYIREQALLPEAEIDRIEQIAPASLLAFQQAAALLKLPAAKDGQGSLRFEAEQAEVEAAARPHLSEWLSALDMIAEGQFDAAGTPTLYAGHRGHKGESD